VLLEICQWLESTRLAALIQESQYGFPLVVGLHILGLAFSVGMLLCVDLRMAGLALRGSRISAVYRGFAPWFLAGYAVMLVSGLTLFTAYATLAYSNVYFRIKVLALLLAGLNALVFHFVTQRSAARWDDAPRPPAGVRAAGVASLALWVLVILAGRMMSYTMFSFPSSP
jgi:Family of unknown function (DUF6644)